VNFNCPGQVSVSGLAEVMPQFSESIRAEGGRVIPLRVKGAFHSPFMKEAAEAFGNELECADRQEQQVTLYSNLTAQPYTSDVVGSLSKQICNPVRWEEIIRNMIADGVDTFIEIGPGKTLVNMIKKIEPEVKVQTVFEVLAEVEAC
jgi:[acyl-carrier-protein] S-malonyltransferase